MRFTVHIYGIFQRKGWHYSRSFNDMNDLLLFFHWKKVEFYSPRYVHKLYRVHDDFDNKDTFFIVDFVKSKNKHNKVKVVDRSIAECYILEV